jgi:catechol 2,3-dioxygenase-like lactoylglutathione lyase family enzyme
VGGHDVPVAAVQRRFHRGRENVFVRYRLTANKWYIDDASPIDGPMLVAEGRSQDAAVVHVTGLGDQRVEIAMMRTPDGHSRLELSRFLAPPVVADHRNAPVNALGYLRVMFTVDDIDGTLERLRTRGAQLVGDVVQYQDVYRLCYIRGPEGLLIGLAQQLR